MIEFVKVIKPENPSGGESVDKAYLEEISESLGHSIFPIKEVVVTYSTGSIIDKTFEMEELVEFDPNNTLYLRDDKAMYLSIPAADLNAALKYFTSTWAEDEEGNRYRVDSVLFTNVQNSGPKASGMKGGSDTAPSLNYILKVTPSERGREVASLETTPAEIILHIEWYYPYE